MKDAKALKKHLFDAYNGFGDKRIKNIDKGDTFIVDDRHPDEANSSGEFNSAMCFIFAKVKNDAKVGLLADPEPKLRIELALQGNAPQNDAVRELIEKKGGAVSERRIQVEIGVDDSGFVRRLAKKIRAITAPGAPRYSVPSYKYACPRVADNLERFADSLDNFASK